MTDKQVARELHGEMRQRCVKAVRRRIGAQMAATLDPEDVVHDSLVQVLARTPLGTDSGEGSTGRCVIALAEFRIREAARRHGREVRMGERVLPDSGAAPDEGLVEQEARAALYRELGSLRSDHQWIIVLRDWLGASWETAAFVLEQPSTNAARCLYKRARSSLATSVRAAVVK